MNEGDLNQVLLGMFDRIYTGRAAEAFEMFLLVNDVAPNNEVALLLKDVLFAIQMGQPIPEGIFYYFGEGWGGTGGDCQDLYDKSIQIVCDQGMGDILNLLGYVQHMKDVWRCRIVLNCYAHYDAMKPLMSFFPFIDEFNKLPVKCDYHTNLMCIPRILSDGDVQYPAVFKHIMECELCEPPSLTVAKQLPSNDDRMNVGIVFSSNKDNDLSVDKSIPVDQLQLLHELDIYSKYRFFSLSPSQEKVSFIEDTKLDNLWETATWINAMDVVVSVDTVVLHLAGLLKKRTYGLLHTKSDPRWETGVFSRWYPNVRLIRQKTAGDWTEPLKELELCLRWNPVCEDE